MSNIPTSTELVEQANYLTRLKNYESGFLQAVAQLGLPVNNIFVDLSERGAVFNNVAGVLLKLAPGQRNNSNYCQNS